MRQLSIVESGRLQKLTENSVELTLIHLTKTGLNKSIMDATGLVRTYLKEKKVHDYNTQLQGQQSKNLISALIITESLVIKSTCSLYRPVTKNGDPRIWFTGLNNYASANDILGIFYFDKILYVLNITDIEIEKLLKSPKRNPLKEIATEIKRESNIIANELLILLRKISSNGPVPALLSADTSIGRTLETLLGININSSKQPDYKGIELKSYRSKEKGGNRKTLFAQVPDWSASKFKSSAEILKNFGYGRGDDIKLYCTVSTVNRNSQGLTLKIDEKLGHLIENSSKLNVGDFVVWALEMLHKRLNEKHCETFWIGADSIIKDGIEHFLYKKVEHTKKPIISQFDILLQQGIITLDHLIKYSAKNRRTSEKGPLFKIEHDCVGLLFPPSQHYNLIEK